MKSQELPHGKLDIVLIICLVDAITRFGMEFAEVPPRVGRFVVVRGVNPMNHTATTTIFDKFFPSIHHHLVVPLLLVSSQTCNVKCSSSGLVQQRKTCSPDFDT